MTQSRVRGANIQKLYSDEGNTPNQRPRHKWGTLLKWTLLKWFVAMWIRFVWDITETRKRPWVFAATPVNQNFILTQFYLFQFQTFKNVKFRLLIYNLQFYGACMWVSAGVKHHVNTLAASYLNTQGLNNSYLKSPASTLVDLTFQSRAPLFQLKSAT